MSYGGVAKNNRKTKLNSKLSSDLSIYETCKNLAIGYADHCGSIGNSVAVLKQLYPNIKWQSGKLLNRVNKKEIETWVATSMK